MMKAHNKHIYYIQTQIAKIPSLHYRTEIQQVAKAHTLNYWV